MRTLNSNFYTKTAYRTVRNFSKNLSPLFQDIKIDLKQANIEIPLLEYISTAVFSSILSFIILVPFISIVIGIIVKGISGIISGLVAGFFISIFVSAVIFVFFYTYPSIKIGNRRKKIDHSLPFAAMYLSTLSGTGIHPDAAFELLANFKEYGEVSKEAEKISRDIKSFGADINTALKRAANRTPSTKFRELLWGIHNVLSSGGNLREFLYERSRNLMNDYMRDLDKFASNLSLFVEIYITLVIVGSVFMMVLSAIMGTMVLGNNITILLLQLLSIFLFLPLAALTFILLVKSISPVD